MNLDSSYVHSYKIIDSEKVLVGYYGITEYELKEQDRIIQVLSEVGYDGKMCGLNCVMSHNVLLTDDPTKYKHYVVLNIMLFGSKEYVYGEFNISHAEDIFTKCYESGLK